ncbi:MAG: tetratricopeptide repeat protein [Deltaproteobacteria bacterium]|nr:tetratricopeptide repeat protein [Deltaproteobacteria bacterium]
MNFEQPVAPLKNILASKESGMVFFFLLLLGFFFWVTAVSGCSFARAREPEVFSRVEPGPASVNFSPGAAYYFSVYNWLRYQDDKESRVEALLNLREAVKVDPGSAYLRLELAEQLLGMRNVEEAQAHAAAALELEPESPRARRLLAGIYSMTGRHEAAILQYEKLLAEDFGNEDSVFFLVALYVETLNYEKALEILKKYREHRPEDALGPFYQGKVYSELKLYQEAERFFREALELDPEMAEAWLHLGSIYEFTERREDAVTVYRRLLELDGDDRQVLERLGQVLVGEGRLDEALAIFLKLRGLGQVPVSIEIKVALIYFQQGDYETAASILKSLHEQHPDQNRVTFYLASSLEALERKSEAQSLFLAIPEHDELFYDARIRAAFIYEDQRDYPACEKVLRELIASYPDKLGLYRMLSSLRRKQDDNQGALQVLQEALARHPDDYKLRFALGVVYNDLGRVADSIAVMQVLLRENPDDAVVLNFVGYTYVEQGVQLEDAEKLLAKALSLKPDSGYILDSMGWLYFVRGDYEKAMTFLQRARDKVPDDPVIFDHLGEVAAALGRPGEALEHYRQSLRFKDDAKVRQKIEKLLQKGR